MEIYYKLKLMFLTGVLFSLFYAVILTLIYTLFFRNKGPWSSFLKFFIILFLIGTVSQLWLLPVGPVAWGFNWLPGLLTAIIVALLIAAVSPSGENNSVGPGKRKDSDVKDELTATSYYSPHSPEGLQKTIPEPNNSPSEIIFFWILICLLSFLLIGGILFSRY
jgi:hypothetical protein